MHQRKYLLGCTILTILLCTGCANEAAQEMMQINKQQACESMAEGQAREDCLRGYEKTFDNYERERRRMVGNKKIIKPELPTPAESDQDGSRD